jgi:hypothetical protein
LADSLLGGSVYSGAPQVIRWDSLSYKYVLWLSMNK